VSIFIDCAIDKVVIPEDNDITDKYDKCVIKKVDYTKHTEEEEDDES
jgi:hypothetical protein